MQDALPHSRPVSRWRIGSLVGPHNPSLLKSLLPSITVLQQLAIALLFIGLLVAFGRARFYLPDNPVPITLQTFGVLLTGSVLGWRWGMFSIVGWYLLGMAGVAVFQGGGNGWAYVSGSPTGGYLIGFILSVAFVGYLSQHGWIRERSLWPMLLGALLLYLPALLWLQFFDFGWPAEGQFFSAGMYVFIPGDLVKVIAASVATGALWAVADRWHR
jgi:biotin transport system substrate-specific component